ncbi:phosphomannomutase 45a [Holotrichia oblita]|nr:phosphomannomutase 45a [Holotrichia oblita]
MDYRQIFQQWILNANDKEIKAQLLSLSESDIEEAFFTELVFGTGGIRGIMGAGTNRLNIYTLKKIAKGTADYLIAKKSKADADENLTNKNLNDHFVNAEKERYCVNDVCVSKNIGMFDKTGVTERRIKAVISYDNRNNSKKFACICAAVLANNGIKAVLTKTCMPTPYLSFMVRRLSADAGIMVTASHNPKEYNGYKLYGSDGCQLTDGDSAIVSGFIAAANPFEIILKPFSYYFNKNEIKITSCHASYLRAVNNSVKDRICLDGTNFGDDFLDESNNNLTKNSKKNSFSKSHQSGINSVPESGINQFGTIFQNSSNVAYSSNKGELRVVYTPLCGTGGLLTPQLLSKAAKVFTVAEQLQPDGNFTFCAVPNPENPLAYQLAITCAKTNSADLIIATDPDADRMGIMVKDKNGEYKFLSGNQIGVLLTYFLLSQNQLLAGSDRHIKRPLIVRTVVSTPMVDKISSTYGAEVTKVLTGFKYIGETIKKLENQGEERRFLLGFEDSHGYLCGGYVRDKDGLQAALIITEFAKILKNQDLTLLDVLYNLYQRFGYYKHKTLSFRFGGAGGSQKIKELTGQLRKEGIKNLINIEKIDYLKGINGLYPTDMLEFKTEQGGVIIRPSGTEPLLKVYLTAACVSGENCDQILDDYEKICKEFFG